MLQLSPGEPAAVLPVALPAESRLAVVAAPAPHQADRHPALVYLASLAEGSRRTMRQALDVIAGLLTGGRATHLTLPWHHLEYAHTAAVRAALAEHSAARARDGTSRPPRSAGRRSSRRNACTGARDGGRLRGPSGSRA